MKKIMFAEMSKLEQDLQRYPFEVTLCYKKCSVPDYLFYDVAPYTIEKKFANIFNALDYAEVCWKRNSLVFQYVEVVRRQDQMSMLYFDVVNPDGYSKHDELVTFENFKENYEVWFQCPCEMSDEEILQRVNEECCPWDMCLKDLSEWEGFYD